MDYKKEFDDYCKTDVGRRVVQFDWNNKNIYKLFKSCAIKAKQAGHTKYSANGIFEFIRWNLTVDKRGTFKMNNTYRSYYARKLMAEQKRFEGFFEIRKGK